MIHQVQFDTKYIPIMAVKVNMIEQSQGVKFESTALNGLRGLAAFHVMVFHTIHYSNFSFSINGTVTSFIHLYSTYPFHKVKKF